MCVVAAVDFVGAGVGPSGAGSFNGQPPVPHISNAGRFRVGGGRGGRSAMITWIHLFY